MELAVRQGSNLSTRDLTAALEALSALPEDESGVLLLRLVWEQSSSVRMSLKLLASAAGAIATMDLSTTARRQFLTSALTLLERVSGKSARQANLFFENLRPILIAAGAPGAAGERAARSYQQVIDVAARLGEKSDCLGESFFRTAAVIVKLEGSRHVEKWADAFELIYQGSFAGSRFPSLTRDPERYSDLFAGILADIADIAMRHGDEDLLDCVIEEVLGVARINVIAGFKCFVASPVVLRQFSLDGFRVWVQRGLSLGGQAPRLLEAYFGYESKLSHDSAENGDAGVSLDSVLPILSHYIEGLTGRPFAIAASREIPPLTRIDEPTRIQLPESCRLFETPDDNFRLYKVLAARAAGFLEFGGGDEEIQPAMERLKESLEKEFQFRMQGNRVKITGAPRRLLKLFPQHVLAERIFEIMEELRIECRLRSRYRGLARDLEWARRSRQYRRPQGVYLLGYEPLLESMYNSLLGLGALEDNPNTELDPIIARAVQTYIYKPGATEVDALDATLEIYRYLDPAAPEESSAPLEPEPDPSSDSRPRENSQPMNWRPSEPTPGRRSEDELALAPAAGTGGAASITITTSESESVNEDKERSVFYYDEWDTALSDHRVAWAKVREEVSPESDPAFVARARSRYASVLSSVIHQFQMLRPEGLKRYGAQVDGDEFDMPAMLDSVVDRKIGHTPSDRIYTQRLRRERDVVVLFLVDMSSSTNRCVDANLRKIIDIEKESLVMMSEALEAVGDRYAIYGFSSHGRKRVSLYRVKSFDEPLSSRVERRISGMKPLVHTRMGAAIRHATSLLAAEPHLTRLLILLTDGEPYDDDGYNVIFYGRDDTRHALAEARSRDVTPFCITIDKADEEVLKKTYGEVGYTIVDDVLKLPERMPGIYRRLTT
jgi:nitric oxide reductase NorD protein